ncbi:MAG: LamG domain-containing protein [Candidatus Eisenbacteria bacterium]|uniref:LamG domain-containing protein n=1 Tax=Eiseniibacteriota bacterium TaxID=2212470 RepID=A0A849SFM6_UNCEI|nr:LamG domain-containing protein [Candidatus Eisenbacteria bacterium]
MRFARAALLCGAGLMLAGCATTFPELEPRVRSRGPEAPNVDSVTVALWRFDDAAGGQSTDTGPFRLAGTFGIDTRPDFGRFGQARRFERSTGSFMVVSPSTHLVPRDGFSCEAWVNIDEYGQYELTPIACCWTEDPNRQSWMFAIGGQRLEPPRAYIASPGFHNFIAPLGSLGRLIFAFQPDAAGAPVSYQSAVLVERKRWVHVAVTLDGELVRLWIDGLLDSQYATRSHIRSSDAPLLVANYFDTRRLTDFTGSLRLDGGDPNPYYAFVGSIDELRISSAARVDFPRPGGR